MSSLERKNLMSFINEGLIVVGFVAMLVTSELIYMVNNQPDYWVTAKVVLLTEGAKFFGEKGYSLSSFRLMERVSENMLARDNRLNKNAQIKSDLQKGISWTNTQFDDVYTTIISGVGVNKISKFDSYYLSSIYYKLAVSAYQVGEDELAVYLMKRSVRLSPNWSYYSLELANLLNVVGKEDEARAVLVSCMENFYTREHCSDFEEQLSSSEEEVGFLGQEIINEFE